MDKLTIEEKIKEMKKLLNEIENRVGRKEMVRLVKIAIDNNPVGLDDDE